MRTYTDAEAAWQRARPYKGVRRLRQHQQFVTRLVWAVLDDFQLGPGEHGRLQRLLDGL